MSKALELAKRDSSGLEQYYTRPEAVAECIEIARKYFNNRVILEPSAGTGEFVKQLTDYEVEAYDLEPKHEDVVQMDFFQFEPEKNGYFTIGNPPYGRNNSLSVRFFNHAAKYSDYVAFIIPKSWRKWTVQNRLDKRFHLVEDIELSKDIFYNGNGESFGSNFNAVFQIWERRDYDRKIVEVEDRGYVSRASYEVADVALVYAGYGSGRVETEFDRTKNNTTKIFLKATDEVIEALKSLDYSRINTNVAYTPVFGLKEVMLLLNEHFDKLEKNNG